jgi:hypothetical protein
MSGREAAPGDSTPSPDDASVLVYGCNAPATALPEALQAEAQALRRAARALGRGIAVVSVDGSPAGVKALAKRRHDLRGALRTLGLATNALAGGYRFDDASAKAKIDAMVRAVAVLARDGELLYAALDAPSGE